MEPCKNVVEVLDTMFGDGQQPRVFHLRINGADVDGVTRYALEQVAAGVARMTVTFFINECNMTVHDSRSQHERLIMREEYHEDVRL